MAENTSTTADDWSMAGSCSTTSFCCIIEHAVDGLGNPEVTGLALRGTVWDDTLGFQTSGVDLVGVSGDFITGFMYGDDGADVLTGSGADDAELYTEQLYGGDNKDHIAADAGSDVVYGGNGADTIFGGDGVDYIWGGAGEDTIFGNGGDDRIQGGTEDDAISGGEDNDTISGGHGDDLVCGDAMTTFGGAVCATSSYNGNDRLQGGSGSGDEVYGQGGDDYICDEDLDIAKGGDGQDDIYISGTYTNLQCGAGTDNTNVSSPPANCELTTLSACPFTF